MLYLIVTLLFLPLLRRRTGGQRLRILVVQNAKIGDAVMTTPLLGALRQCLPGASICVMHQPMTREVLEGHAWVDRTIEVDPKSWSGFRGKWALARKLRAEDFDAALVLSPSLPVLLAVAWARIPERLAVMPAASGSSLRLARRLLTGFVLNDGTRHLSDSQIELLPRLGCAGGQGEQRVEIKEPSEDSALAALARRRFVVGVGVNAGNSLKSLDDALLAAICVGILQEPDASVALIGSGADVAKAREISRQVADPRLIDLTGRYSLRELPAVLARLSAFVGVDSGATHLADAVGVPQVVVSGPVNIVEFMPRTGGSKVITPANLPCAPCVFSFRTPYACATTTHACVRALRVAEVVEGVRALLAEKKRAVALPET